MARPALRPRGAVRAALLAALVLAALAAAPGAATASTGHPCSQVTTRHSELAPLATVLRVNGMTCRRARRVVRTRHVRGGGDRFQVGGRFRLGRFHCRVYHHIEEDTRARCTRAGRAFRVDYGS
jgi:hypothetical protein